MVATPRMKEELRHWESELYLYETKLCGAVDPFEREHWQHMVNYGSQKILKLERELYQTP